MSHLAHITGLAAATLTGAFFSTAAAGAEYTAALKSFAVNDAQTDRPLEGVVWYPATAGAPTTRVQGNPVWTGVDAAESAQIAAGTFPLVVLSHGMYGNMRNQNWLASELAADGYIVAAVNHPGTSTFLRAQDDARQLWERPRDISRVITHFTKAGDISAQVDDTRIYMAGHSLGGWTAVMLSGGISDPERFDAFCASGADPFVCAIMDRWDIAKTPEDRAMMAQDYADDRISAVAVFDLGGTQFFSEQSLENIAVPLLVIGAPKNVTQLDLDLESRHLAKAVPDDVVTYLEPETVSHFDFLGLCTPKAVAILRAEEPDDVIVCLDGIEERQSDHAGIVSAVKAHFTQTRP